MTTKSDPRIVAIEAEGRLAEGKDSLALHMQRIATLAKEGHSEEFVDELLDYHRAATRLFNEFDQSIPNARLFGAHQNEDWRRNQADTCRGLLEHILTHFSHLRTLWSTFGIETDLPRPSSGAYSQIQSLVRLYYPDVASELAKQFHKADLPTIGFEVPAVPLASFRMSPESIEGSGLASRDVSEIVRHTSSIRVGDRKASGALSRSGMAQSIAALQGETGSSSFSKRMMDEIHRSPIRLAVGLAVAVLGGLLTVWLFSEPNTKTVPGASPDPGSTTSPGPSIQP